MILRADWFLSHFFKISPCWSRKTIFYQVVSNINYLGSSSFRDLSVLLTKSIEKCFSSMTMHLELFIYHISKFNFFVHLLIHNFCCSFNGLLSLKNVITTGLTLFPLWCLHQFLRMLDIGIGLSSRCFPSRPRRWSSLFNMMLITCFTSQSKSELLIKWF